MLIKEKQFLRKKLGRLKKHERLIVDRRRRGLTQRQEAEKRDVTHYIYRQWEKGFIYDDYICFASIKNIGIFEICFLLRRRNKLKIEQIANALNVSKAWISEMEKGTVYIGDLVEYWMHRYGK